ncbi:MAG: RNA 2',3'-cyclic phosphodiesterase [gamma proteobacterium symbiont of Bathyaustriella thionipta]|nr:RNA 2',3'-cyclic phosphodiesterase [gamma proteobacterium symbiont of Bathyaustriella thionipta]
MTESSSASLFLALKPPADVRSKILAVAHQYAVDGRLHQPQDLHLTLVFLGMSDTQTVTCYKKTIGKLSAMCFTLNLDVMDFWSKPAIQWCGPSKPPDALQQLHHGLNRRLVKCGFQPESRAYRPHVTLRRKVRSFQSVRLQQPIEWRVEHFHLFATSRAAGSRYHLLESWQLSA